MRYSTSLLLFTLTFLFPTPALNHPTPSKVSDWLHKFVMPKPGSTPRDEIKCYNLPFGGLGMLSHILTFYTAGMLLLGRSPMLPPGARLKHSWVELILAVLTLLGSVPIAILTIISCHSRWEFVCIAIWKITLSFTLAAINSHQGTVLMQHHRNQSKFLGDDEMDDSRTFRTGRLTKATAPALYFKIDWQGKKGAYWWLAIFVAGTIVGLFGLIPLVVTYYHDVGDVKQAVKVFTNIFTLFVGVPLLFWLIWIFFLTKQGKAGFGFAVIAVWIGLICAVWADWVLAAIADNWGGMPSGDIAVFFWIYFAAKRLPMFSM
jgi:hypothetical protein